MKVPQPFQYQGSKRALAATILQYLPQQVQRVVEPFAGSAAFSIACAARSRAKEYWLNDFNKPLAELVGLIVNQPEGVADFYKATWRGEDEDALEHYYRIREDFNRTNDPKLLLYLLARCVKGSVRYNSEGLFNQSPDKRRLGTRPETMRENIIAVSMLMRGRTIVTAQDYRDVLENCRDSDVIYMDPPYQGVCGERDSRYLSGISFADFVTSLDRLNTRGVRYIISYDGRLGDQKYGEPLPDYLGLTLVEIEAGRSSQATLLGREDVTFESLYLSQSLAEEVGGSANRAKSWSCEHCTNWQKDKKKEICLSCYWAFPENYNHVAMRQVRRLDLMWQGNEIEKYDVLKSDAQKAGMTIPDFVKDVLTKTIKK